MTDSYNFFDKNKFIANLSQIKDFYLGNNDGFLKNMGFFSWLANRSLKGLRLFFIPLSFFFRSLALISFRPKALNTTSSQSPKSQCVNPIPSFALEITSTTVHLHRLFYLYLLSLKFTWSNVKEHLCGFPIGLSPFLIDSWFPAIVVWCVGC